MKNILFIFLSICFISTGISQIHVTNSASEPIYVAIAHYRNTASFRGWVSEGWWKVIPGETKVCGDFLKTGENTYYIHAHTASFKSKWGNDAYLAVNKVDAFEIENCDKSYVLEDSEITTYQFTKKFVNIGLLDELKASVNFTN